jgi:hypothetical protein
MGTSNDTGGKASGDVRQGDVDHGGVEHLHEGGEHDGGGDNPRVDARVWVYSGRHPAL